MSTTFTKKLTDDKGRIYLRFDSIIIGAGAAGMMAAITAARAGRKVAVFEKNDRIGKKLRITGKGRCNVTNFCTRDEFMENVPVNSRFMYSSFSAFTPQDVMDFFENAGVPLKVERGNRVFPVSDKAADIVSALDREMKKAGVKLVHETVKEIIVEDGVCCGVRTDKGEHNAQTVLVATGGASYPLTGSTGDGYRFAAETGHTVTPVVPSLVPLETADDFCEKMSGLALKNVTLTLYDGNKKIYSELGEMSFMNYGVTGPLVLTASSRIRKMERGRYVISIDLKPGLDEEKLDKRLLRDFTEMSSAEFKSVLVKLLPSKMIPVIVKRSGISSVIKAGQISKEQRKGLVKLLKDFRLNVTDFRPVEEAIVTSGGVSIKEIDPKTMESKIVSGLFFAGEVIDVDGYTGGFNLQIAFSTGYTAGMNI
ncbi:MAG: NAD(P)/FAD-dependent oxidoreductase [Oscillospiraceae bacterium]|nr:NAD(P)/FAD-dependent oxidoreductase [Oscillospiraceae bacterium]